MTSVSKEFQCNQDVSEEKNLWDKILEGVNLRPNESGNDKGEAKGTVQSSPTMVFSVIGDSDSFVPRPWPKTVFQTALIEAAKSGGETWILYSGAEQGVSKVVRDAYKYYEDMEFKTKSFEKEFNDPDRHVKLISMAGNKTKNTKDTKSATQKGKSFIEVKPMKPTVFKTTSGKGDNFLLKFEKFISEQTVAFFSQKLDARMPVPVAIIVCEGDIDTIAHIAKALERKLPVIIMKGSGTAADVVVDYLENEDLLPKKASILLGIQFDDTKYRELKTHLEKIRIARNLVGIFDLDRDDPLTLSNIVGDTVVSCWSIENILETIKHVSDDTTKYNSRQIDSTESATGKGKNPFKGFSLAWKLLRRNFTSPEEKIIKKVLIGYKESRPYVLNPKYSTPTSLPLYFYFGYQLLQEYNKIVECGPVLLLEALKANRCDYVRVLIDRGVHLKMIDLPELYEQTVACKKCKFEKKDCLHMQWILKQIQETHAKQLCHEFKDMKKKQREKIKEANNDLNKESDDLEKETKKLSQSVADAATGLCRKMLRYKEYNTEEQSQQKPINGNDESKDADISDILLWAIFANRKDIAEICWLRGDNHLLTGLVCSAILRKLSKKANNVKEQVLSSDLEEHSKLFERRCIGMMDSMYEEDSKHAINLMDDEAVVWGIYSSPLTFAYENFMYDIVAHTSSQKLMNKQWYNNLAPDLKPFLKSAFKKPKRFLTAPLTKYVFNYMMFFSMLVMYSAFVLTSISTKYYVLNIGRLFEYYVYFWSAGDFIEELISCFGYLEARGRSHRGYYSRMKRYLYDFWNVVDLLSYALLIAALSVRHFHPSEKFTVARRMFSLSLLVMYLRFLEVFLIHRKLGPTLIMIKEMLKDLFRFLFIAVFVVLGVGMYYHANLWPDHQTIWSGDWTNWRIWTIIYYPYWQLYGELNLESLDGSDQSDCTNETSIWESDTSIERCPREDWTVPAVAAIYLLFSNLLLVNLVIAMFSYTFERVQENSEKLWRFERYTVINDYDWRIPSPINILFLPYRFLCCPAREECCLQQCKRLCDKKGTKEKLEKRRRKEEFRRNFQKITALKNHNKI